MKKTVARAMGAVVVVAAAFGVLGGGAAGAAAGGCPVDDESVTSCYEVSLADGVYLTVSDREHQYYVDVEVLYLSYSHRTGAFVTDGDNKSTGVLISCNESAHKYVISYAFNSGDGGTRKTSVKC